MFSVGVRVWIPFVSKRDVKQVTYEVYTLGPHGTPEIWALSRFNFWRLYQFLALCLNGELAQPAVSKMVDLWMQFPRGPPISVCLWGFQLHTKHR